MALAKDTVRTDIQFAFGLFSYLRSLQLSLDRTRKEPRSEIINFIESENMPTPIAVALSIKEILTRKIDEQPTAMRAPKWFLPSTIHMRRGHINVDRGTLKSALQALEALQMLIKTRDHLTLEKINETRLKIASSERHLARLMPRDLEKRGELIIHLNHSQNLPLEKFRDLVGLHWPGGNFDQK